MSAKEVAREVDARLFVDADMGEAEALALAGGEVVVYSARGPDSAGNQDAAGLYSPRAGEGVLAVADGLGGQPGGASAARIAIECLRDELAQSVGREAPLRAAILDSLEAANRTVLELGIGAGTTIAAAELLVGTLRPYHVGDSEILVVGQRGRIKLQTVSHSPVGYAVEAGLLTPTEALHHDDRHLVSNLIGSPDMRIEVGSPMVLAPRDTVLLATDGLFDNLTVREIVKMIRAGPLLDAASALIRACESRMQSPGAGEPSKPDDVTFILYRGGR